MSLETCYSIITLHKIKEKRNDFIITLHKIKREEKWFYL